MRIPLAILLLALAPAGAEAQPAAKPSPLTLDKISADLQALTDRVAPSVVQIIATGYTAPAGGLLVRERNAGSGAIVDERGHIVTNAHVVEGAQGVEVLLMTPPRPGGSILKPRSRRLPAKVVGIDTETDLAVLKVEEAALPALTFGDSEELRQGQIVLAIGSPLGLENSVSLGVVSAVARQLKPEDPMIYVQTDAPINPGNSGGPLVDTRGRLVGLNTLIASQGGGNEGIGFAAPSNIVRAVYQQIRAHGRVRRGGIGARAQTLSPALAGGLGLPQDWGVLIADVTPEGPADAAGLKIGDIVLALDGKPMENARQLEVNLYRRSVGDTVTLEVLRAGRKQPLSVSVVERPEDPDRFALMVTPERNLIPRLGILGIEIDESVRRLLPGLRGEDGVVVAARDGSGADDDALKAGDVIYALNGVSVRGLAELRSAVDRLKTGDPVALQVERRGQLQFVAFRVE